MNNLKSQIVATIGPKSESFEVLSKMVENGVDIIRMNFSWGDFEEHQRHIDVVREVENKLNKKVLLMIDLPGPRIQTGSFHTYSKESISSITEKDVEFIKFGIEQNIDLFALSYVGSKEDVKKCRDLIASFGGTQKIISKIERQDAIDHLDEIVELSDAIMLARGDLGNEIPLEQIPFVQADIIKGVKKHNKPVITATEMLLSMVSNELPSRADVTDIAYATLLGSDYVMLSNETTVGQYPAEAVLLMKKVVLEAKKHVSPEIVFNSI